MSRFGEDPERFFASVYEGPAPWDIGGPQPALLELFRDFPVQDPVLDLGSGSGDLSIWLAMSGLRTIGLEFIASAVEGARRRSASLSGEVAARLEFRQADALKPSRLGRTFGAVVDSGFYHLFEPEQCSRLADEIAAVVHPGGRYYVLAFAIDLPAPDVPRGISPVELRRHFSPERGWSTDVIRATEFVSTVATVPAVAACFQRIKAGLRPGDLT